MTEREGFNEFRLWALRLGADPVSMRRMHARTGVADDAPSTTAAPARFDSDAAQAETPLRRHYPKVLPKYRNPDRPSETWAGRGIKPRWFAQAMLDGRHPDELSVDARVRGRAKRRRALA